MGHPYRLIAIGNCRLGTDRAEGLARQFAAMEIQRSVPMVRSSVPVLLLPPASLPPRVALDQVECDHWNLYLRIADSLELQPLQIL